MRLTVLGSSSRANGYVIENEKEALIIECGCPLSDTLKALGYNSSKIKACIVTHEHGDHSEYIDQYMERMTVYCSKGTSDALKYKGKYRPKVLRPMQKLRAGGFTILPFDTKHDSAEPFGYLIHHNDCGNILFVTDSYYIKYRFDNLSHILIEANYSEEILEENIEAGRVPKVVRDRVYKSHMSIKTTIETLKANDMTKVVNIVLLHLSKDNGDVEEFQRLVERSTGKVTHIAAKGLEIELNRQANF